MSPCSCCLCHCTKLPFLCTSRQNNALSALHGVPLESKFDVSNYLSPRRNPQSRSILLVDATMSSSTTGSSQNLLKRTRGDQPLFVLLGYLFVIIHLNVGIDQKS
ncbi:hypothetical protein BS17DRAFT_89578 [Gyrodon lividus]|nr:hypothetical protein BS17DRAFT_89578 [Gyrodon lividus]